MATTVSAARTPTMWLNFPLRPNATYSRGEMLLPVIPTWRDRGAQPLSVTFRVAANSAPSSAANAESSLVLARLDACTEPDHDVRTGEYLDVIVTVGAPRTALGCEA